MSTEPITLDLHHGPVVVPVLTRVVTAIAGRAGIELDRLGDLEIIVTTIAPSVRSFTLDGRVRIAIASPDPGAVVLHIGPLRPGGAEGLQAACVVPGVGHVIDRLADRLWVDRGPDGEYWALEVVAGTTAPAR